MRMVLRDGNNRADAAQMGAEKMLRVSRRFQRSVDLHRADYRKQEEIERHKKLMAALHNAPTGTLCPQCEGQALCLLCDSCTQKIKEIADVK